MARPSFDHAPDFFKRQLKSLTHDPKLQARVWRQLTQQSLPEDWLPSIVPGDLESSPDGLATFASIPPELQTRSNLFGRFWSGKPERDSLIQISVLLASCLPTDGCSCDDCLVFSPFWPLVEDLRDDVHELRRYYLLDGGYGADDSEHYPSDARDDEPEETNWIVLDLEAKLSQARVENRELEVRLADESELREIAQSEADERTVERDQARLHRDALRRHNRDLKRESYLLRQQQGVSPSFISAGPSLDDAPSIQTCAEAVEFARSNLDFVEFADKPKLDLVPAHDAHAEELLRCILGFEEWCVARPSMGVDSWLMSAESAFQLGGRKRFAMAESETVQRQKGTRLFPVPRWADKHGFAPMVAHVKFGSSLRLYYRVYWPDEHPVIVVGYIGQHLKVKSTS